MSFIKIISVAILLILETVGMLHAQTNTINSDAKTFEIEKTEPLIEDTVFKAQEEEKQRIIQQKIDRKQEFWDNITKGFKGSNEDQEMMGGFHFRYGNSNMYFNYDYITGNKEFDMYYNYSKIFPLTVEYCIYAGGISGDNLGLYSSYNFSKRFTFDYGVGYQFGEYSTINLLSINPISTYFFHNPYFKLGSTFMFNGKYGGGLNYSYTHGILSNGNISSHNITYIFGRRPSIGVGIMVIILCSMLLYFGPQNLY